MSGICALPRGAKVVVVVFFDIWRGAAGGRCALLDTGTGGTAVGAKDNSDRLSSRWHFGEGSVALTASSVIDLQWVVFLEGWSPVEGRWLEV